MSMDKGSSLQTVALHGTLNNCHNEPFSHWAQIKLGSANKKSEPSPVHMGDSA